MDNEKHIKSSEIYSNSYGAVYQCDHSGKFYLNFSGKTSELNFPCFLCFRKLVNKLDLEKLSSDASPGSDIEIVSPCGIDRCFVLDYFSAEGLKDLLNGAKCMMELNSILHEKLRRLPVY